MKSPQVYRTLREVVGRWTKAAGFKRGTGGMLSYVRPVSGSTDHQTFWFQCSQHGWDEYAGSQFTVEFQQATEPGPGAGTLDRRWRFFELLTPGEREEVRALQNGVIKKLRRPPRDHLIFTLDAASQKILLADFDLVHPPYDSNEDVWMRYAEEADVRGWANFLLPLLPRMLDGLAAKAG